MSHDSTSSSVTDQKRTMGRKKIDIKKIQNMQSLQVTFSKRRSGLFKKASQLSTLCGADVAIIVFSPHGRPFVFGHPSVDSVISRLANTSTAARDQDVCMHAHASDDDDDTESTIVLQSNSSQFDKDYRTSPNPECLRLELRCGGGGGGGLGLVTEESGGGGFWWDQPIEEMSLDEVKLFGACLEELRANVALHLDDKVTRELAERDYFGVNHIGSKG